MPPRERPQTDLPLSLKSRVLGGLAATLIRALCVTLRIRVEDRSGLLAHPPDHSLIWVFWHNRILVMPVVYRRHAKSRTGAVLTSASRDGEVIAATMRCFGAASVRGSSSRRSRIAMLQLADWVGAGHDVVFTPDGPRGPRYRLQPGLIKLAQRTGAKVLPIRVEYESAWIFKSWDRFRLPKPFSRVDVVFEPYETIDPDADEDSFEAARLRIETILNPDHETD